MNRRASCRIALLALLLIASSAFAYGWDWPWPEPLPGIRWEDLYPPPVLKPDGPFIRFGEIRGTYSVDFRCDRSVARGPLTGVYVNEDDEQYCVLDYGPGVVIATERGSKGARFYARFDRVNGSHGNPILWEGTVDYEPILFNQTTGPNGMSFGQRIRCPMQGGTRLWIDYGHQLVWSQPVFEYSSENCTQLRTFSRRLRLYRENR